MAYSAPELLLVGAAQNLVLAASGEENTQPLCHNAEYEDDIDDGLYQADPLW